MGLVNRITTVELAPLLDREYIQKYVPEDVCITFACLPGNEDREGYWQEDGTHRFIIQLPYEEVKNLPPVAIREMMLKLTMERLKTLPRLNSL